MDSVIIKLRYITLINTLVILAAHHCCCFTNITAAASLTTAIKAAAAILARGTKRERILDVGAGHGTYGLALATQRGTRGDSSHSSSVITALDKPEVLKIAAVTAAATPGVTPQRYVQLPGNYIIFSFNSTVSSNITSVDSSYIVV
jgi:hypothetical protein